MHTWECAPLVRSLEVWEKEPSYEAPLRRNLPTARVKIGDTFEEIKRTRDRFDFIMVDNPLSNFDGHCEHFDLFPDVLRVAKDDAIISLNVVPKVGVISRHRWPYVFNEKQLARRREFYGVKDPAHVTLGQMILTYRELATRTGFRLDWWFTVRRHAVHCMVLKLTRTQEPDDEAAEVAISRRPGTPPMALAPAPRRRNRPPS